MEKFGPLWLVSQWFHFIKTLFVVNSWVSSPSLSYFQHLFDIARCISSIVQLSYFEIVFFCLRRETNQFSIFVPDCSDPTRDCLTMPDVENQATVDTGSSSHLPIILGVTGGVLFVVMLLIYILWYRRQLKAKRTLKWKELGLDSPPAKGTTQRRFKLQRQKTIEFELPIAPKFITTLPQVNYDRYDSIGKIQCLCLLHVVLTAIHFKNTNWVLNDN